MRKFWVISEYAYPVLVSTGYYVTEIAQYIKGKGVDVGIITTNNTYYASDVVSEKKYEQYNGIDIHRAIGLQVDKNSFIKRFWRLLISSSQLFGLAIKNLKEGDVVVCLTNPAFFILLMPIVKMITGCKYHILVHDIFPENLVSIGKLSNKGFAFSMLKKIFDWAYSNADSCISIGCDMLNVIKGKIKDRSSSIVIPNWADIDDVVPIEKYNTVLYKEYESNLKDKVVFQFAGNLGNAQGLDNLLSAIGMVDNPNAAFLFVGSGAKAKDVELFSKEHDNTIFAGFRNRSSQNDFLNSCDIGIVTLADGMYGLGVPSKSYNIMATGKPILYIGHFDSEIAVTISKYDIGWIVEPNNPTQLMETINNILSEKEDIIAKGKKSLEVAHNVFAKPIILEKFYQLVYQYLRN